MKFIGKLDLTQAYCQYAVEPALSARLGCVGPDGNLHSWRVLPFGLSHAPRVFCSLTSLFIKKWRSQGIRCFAYIDDIVFFAAYIPDFVAAAEVILGDLRDAKNIGVPEEDLYTPFHAIGSSWPDGRS